VSVPGVNTSGVRGNPETARTGQDPSPRRPWTVEVVLAGVVAAVAVTSIGVGTPASWLGIAVLAGYAVRLFRLLRLRRVERERRQAAELHRAVSEERARIARELHDVITHRMSLITVQAGEARAVTRNDPERTDRALAGIEDACRQALGELRHLLDELRPESAPAGSPGSDPESDPGSSPGGAGSRLGLSGLPRLVTQLSEAGLTVSLSTDGAPAALPAHVDLSVYRIVQEALTNVLRHAGPGTPTEVRVGSGTDRRGAALVRIEVLDRGPGIAVATGTGHGIVGMRERAALLGGSFFAGRRPGGGFRVLAELPVGERP
jgi:signal transduction histidine kinase